MAQVKISELDEKLDITGDEMLPIQLDDVTYKMSVDQIIERGKELLHTIQKYTYDELKQLKDSKLLKPGEYYILTDYQCIYIQPMSEELITSDYDGWLLMLLATSENSFSVDAKVFFTEDSSYVANGGKQIITCKYLFDSFDEYEWADATSKGIIIDLEDISHNRCSYDFKHIKFRRWALKDVTENDTVGAANQPSAYRCYGTDEEPARSDGRTWVGSGLEMEKKYIKSIFAGTFNSEVWGQEALHEDYITKLHKPFKQTDYDLQYVAWSSTLEELSDLTSAKPGLAKYEVDVDDYKDCYTFEYNDTDFSNKIHVRYNHIYRQKYKQLPNIVILLANNVASDKYTSMCVDNVIQGYNTTYALHITDDEYWPYFNRNRVLQTNNSIWNGIRFASINITGVEGYNYISGSLHDVTIGEMSRSVLFGYYSSLSFKNCNYNLLFGNEFRIVKADGNWASPADGNYWYNDEIQEWFGYNIMAPFQYSVFYPHTNTNTVKLPYNKGVTLMGTFQDNFVERMRWGVVIEYGACQGQYLTELIGTHITPSAFVSQVMHSSGVSSIYKLEGAPQFPSINGSDVKMFQVNLKTLASNLTSEVKEKLANRTRKIFTNNGTSPVVKYYSEL